ncbi:hypothetical protein PI95_000845 [Hassallia byssoidea VB512170]|uniref:Uncharacterized protein n=1 Tax=Hassallia byssoidea VB512170 TaxID=1304833 RepID=A0A846H3F4_9CYAN|nr:hypothetical protein [Hassalia byssoidea]NEU71160.1 hypothetical protein [Hassalia byssoidea VB512170]
MGNGEWGMGNWEWGMGNGAGQGDKETRRQGDKENNSFSPSPPLPIPPSPYSPTPGASSRGTRPTHWLLPTPHFLLPTPFHYFALFRFF